MKPARETRHAKRSRQSLFTSAATIRTSTKWFALFLFLLVSFASLPSTLAATVNYDIVYVRQPRYGDNTNTTWPEVFHPARLDPGADLMLLHPDGSEEVLVAGGNGSVTDIAMRFGFRELGRFAGDYRARFGESPSETLRRGSSRGR